jgi:hypothetical protein
MSMSVNERVQKRRALLRASGLRPLQIWVPDARRPGFAEECLRQAKIVARADLDDADLERFIEGAFADTDDWTA